MAFWFFGRKKDEEIEKLKTGLKHSFLNIKKDMELVNEMLEHFKKKHDQHEQKHIHHDQRLEKIEQDLAEMGEILGKNALESPTRIGHSIVHERSIVFKRSNQSFMNVQRLKNILTPAQKRIIQLLMIAETPLEYKDLARELNISVITVRRHINDIKKMGFDLKERINTDVKRKVFYIEKELKRAIKARK